MDRLANMEVFARVVEAASFTGAAARLGLSRAAVSKRIQNLETDLGAKLLNRTTRSVSPTEVGRSFYERCLQVLEEATNAEEIVRQMHAEPKGQLRINAPQSFGNLHLAGALTEFARAHPALDIQVMLTDNVVNLAREGADVAIRVAREPPPNLAADFVSPVRILLCASTAYLRRRGRPKRPEDLSKHDCLHYTYMASGETWHLTDGEQSFAVPINTTFEANSGDFLLEAAIGGLGIVSLPSFIVWKALASGDLEIVLPDYPVRELSLFAVYARENRLSAKIRLLVSFLEDRFGDSPYWDAS